VNRIAKQLAEERQDVVGMNCLRNESGNIIVKSEMAKKRWKEYCIYSCIGRTFDTIKSPPKVCGLYAGQTKR